MIRQRIELLAGNISDTLYKNIMEATTADIKINRVFYRQKTSFDSMIERALIALDMYISSTKLCLYCGEEENPFVAKYCFNCGEKLRSI
jgi:hypothetical protein